MNETLKVSHQDIIHMFCDWLKLNDINPDKIDIIAILKFNRWQFLIDCIKSGEITYPHQTDITLIDKNLLLMLQFAECHNIRYTRCFGTVVNLYLYLEPNLKLSEILSL